MENWNNSRAKRAKEMKKKMFYRKSNIPTIQCIQWRQHRITSHKRNINKMKMLFFFSTLYLSTFLSSNKFFLNATSCFLLFFIFSFAFAMCTLLRVYIGCYRMVVLNVVYFVALFFVLFAPVFCVVVLYFIFAATFTSHALYCYRHIHKLIQRQTQIHNDIKTEKSIS